MLRATIGGELISREQARELAHARGLQVRESVTKKLDVLVVADPQTASGKAKEARDYGTRILAEAAFWQLIGVATD
jgi:DNA polymerase-3 subunit epsilon